VANTGVTFAVFNLCAALPHLPAAWANVIGWVAGFANSFVWNRTWTFGDRRHLQMRRVLPRFALASLLALGVSEGVLLGLHAVLLSTSAARQLPQAVLLNGIELAAIGCSLCVSYAVSANWAFRKS
jgi:putative flippase GtrA